MTFNVVANVALNLALIPLFGITGAAVATAVAFAVSTLAVNGTAWKWLGYPGGLVFTRV